MVISFNCSTFLISCSLTIGYCNCRPAKSEILILYFFFAILIYNVAHCLFFHLLDVPFSCEKGHPTVVMLLCIFYAAVACAVDLLSFAVLALLPESSMCTESNESMSQGRDGAILLFNVMDPVPVATWSVRKVHSVCYVPFHLFREILIDFSQSGRVYYQTSEKIKILALRLSQNPLKLFDSAIYFSFIDNAKDLYVALKAVYL